VIHPTSVWFFL